jgi:hypothetical protein
MASLLYQAKLVGIAVLSTSFLSQKFVDKSGQDW